MQKDASVWHIKFGTMCVITVAVHISFGTVGKVKRLLPATNYSTSSLRTAPKIC